MSKFKYQKQIESIPNYPSSACKPMNIEAFRFVFEDMNHINNFLPVLLIKPMRRLPTYSARCSGYALSFFTTLEKARSRYLELKKRGIKNIEENLGTHIAKGTIDETDGVVSEINKSGHFDLHEFKNTDLKRKFDAACVIEG